MDSILYKSSKTNEFSAVIDRNSLWDQFEFYELTKNMRQKDDSNH